MQAARFSASVAVAVVLLHAATARSASPAPSFETAYLAWDVVTDLARSNGDPAISGECGKTFRPFVIPGLRRQTRQDEEATAATCIQAARSACTNSKLRISAEAMKKCEPFK